MKTFSRITIAISLLTLLHCTGCSWIFMRRAPDEYKNQASIECSGKTAPIVDTVIAGSYLLSAVSLLIAALGPEGDQCSSDSGMFCVTPKAVATIMVPVWALGALIHGLSAWSGYCWAKECRNVKNKHNRWQLNLPPGERLEFERRVEERRCEKLESRMKMLPSKSNTSQYISECREVIQERAAKRDGQGQTELHRAVREEDSQKLKILLLAGVDPNTPDKYGWTPLHYAAAAGNRRHVRMLLSKGANPLAKNNENQTPIHLAHDKEHDEIVKILRSYARKRMEKRGEKKP
jgi:hypothetical protein